MYVEISPRQSGKTTRLVEAAATYLRVNPDSIIAIVSHSNANSNGIKSKIRDRLALNISLEQGLEWPDDLIYRMIDNVYTRRIRKSTRLPLGSVDPDYWFIDEFAFLNTNDLFPGDHYSNFVRPHNITLNAYYCTTPSTNPEGSIHLISYCRDNGHTIHFNNPWTEARLEEQAGLAPYMRQAVLGDWVEFMTEQGFPINGLKENWLPKFIKRHTFLNANKRF